MRTSVPTTLGASAQGHRGLLDLARMSRALADRDIDVLFFPTIYSYVPVLSRARKLVMIHDFTSETHPQITIGSAKARFFWRTKIVLARWQADALLTVSEYSRDGIARYFNTPAQDIHVIGEANAAVFRPIDDPRPTSRLIEAGVEPGRRTIVFVGGFSPHKNIAGLIGAFSRIAGDRRFSDVDLYLVGDYEHDNFVSAYPQIRTQIERLGLGARVRFTGFLPDDDLVVLLNLATMLVLPSLSEGFGLPAIEAAACGCPVIATKNSPLPGILGEGGLFIDPYDQHGLESAIRQLLDSQTLRHRLAAAGLRVARDLNWHNPARELLELMTALARP